MCLFRFVVKVVKFIRSTLGDAAASIMIMKFILIILLRHSDIWSFEIIGLSYSYLE